MIVASWSGPRNLSTAMMYAFGNRPDFEVMDEPYYAAYLAATGLDHPMRDDILAAGPCDPAEVAAACAAKPAAHCYQKHMTHHMVAGFDRAWFDTAAHVFLIRHPARVLASYAKKREAPELADIGFLQQCEIYDEVRARGLRHVVIDSYDIRQQPEAALRALCLALGLGFDPAMLSWPAGGHRADGVWAAHWYDAVHASTGFAGPEGPRPDLPPALAALEAAARPAYDRMAAAALRL